MKILSCEDHDLLRDGLHQVMRELPGSPTLLEASTAAEAVEVLEREGDVALVLLDLGLPDVDGLDLLKQLCILVTLPEELRKEAEVVFGVPAGLGADPAGGGDVAVETG